MNFSRPIILFLFFFSTLSNAQPPPSEKWIKIIVAPDRPTWLYSVGETVRFSVAVLKANVLMQNVKVSYEVGPEKMPASDKQELILKEGTLSIEGGTLTKPGFLRCTVKVEYEGKTYQEWTTAAFSPEKIEPTVILPADFKDYWSKAIEENTKLPIDTKMTLLPERCTEKVNSYHVSIQNWKLGARVYGILTIPKKEGKYPAILKVPGAGIRPYQGDVAFAEEGIISLEIGIHGISVIMPQQNYDDLQSGGLNQYYLNNLNERDRYFYKRVFLGCLKANDFLTSLPQWDGKNLGVMGSSQGGALSIVTAGLDKRVTAAAITHPAMCDMTGTLFERAGGWPQPFANKADWTKPSHSENLNTIQYYDALNFARNISVPVLFSFGYNDNVCPPTSVSAAYNIIKSPKQQYLALESAHWVFPEQSAFQRKWMIDQLKK
ncbi:MAG: acetylxylan esterase [Bacteroidota bacterium]